jgi:hypothetical protein
MEIRIFQWLVPILALLFLISQLLRYYRGRIDLRETVSGILLWLGVAVLAIFPDTISNAIAEALGFKSNTNAVLFFGMGLLFYFQYRLYHIQVQQRRQLTKLTRALALQEFLKEEKEA